MRALDSYEFRVFRDPNSGALMLEKEIAAMERRAIKFTMTFKPNGLWERIMCWFGLDYPGPILAEFEINAYRMYILEKRFRHKTKVVQEFFSILDPGKGQIRVVMNPEDFNKKWKVEFEIASLDN